MKYTYEANVARKRSRWDKTKQELEDAEALRCPRCNQKMYPPRVALSRLDNQTDVCPDCGLDEAIQQWQEGSVTNWKEQLK